jgi:hypothetical protein
MSLRHVLPSLTRGFNPDFAVGCKTCPESRRMSVFSGLMSYEFDTSVRIIRPDQNTMHFVSAEGKFLLLQNLV